MKSDRAAEHVREKRVLAICLFAVSCCSIWVEPEEFRISVVLQWAGVQARLSEFKKSVLHYNWLSWVSESPERLHFAFELELAVQKEGNGISRNMTTKELCCIILGSCCFPVVVKNLPWKWQHRRKRKDRQPTVPLPFSSSYSSVRWR